MFDVDVFVPTMNNVRTVGYVLDCLLKEVDSQHITIVDNFSTDGTVDEARKRGVNVLQTRVNIGLVRSLMIAVAKSRLMCMVDADLRLPQDWLRKSLEWLARLKKRDSSTVAVWGACIPCYGKDREYYLATRKTWKLPFRNYYRLDTSNLLIETEAARGFRADTYMMDDYLLGRFLLAHGKSFWRLPLYVWHDNYETKTKEDRALYLSMAASRLVMGLSFRRLLLRTVYVPLVQTPPLFKVWLLRRYVQCWGLYVKAKAREANGREMFVRARRLCESGEVLPR